MAGTREAQVERARVAVALSFGLNGLVFSSWIARVPAVRDRLGLTSGQLGLLLLCIAVGAAVALPFSGPLVQRITPARAVLAGSAGVGVGILCVAAGLALRSIPLCAGGLALQGIGNAGWDVAMNVEGADIERRLGRSLMPRLHAAFSLGTVAGAAVGAVCALLGVDLQVQLAVTGLVVAIVMRRVVAAFLEVEAVDPAAAVRQPHRASTEWRRRTTLLLGVLVLCFALAEGVAGDWLALATRDGHHASDATGAGVYACFVAAMTAVRTFGGLAIARFGRRAVLRGGAGCAAAGVLLVALGPGVPSAAVGALLWGCGAALGFPIGMSAAADDPHAAALRVSVVSSIGYAAFLGGPPLIGFVAEQAGLLHALLVVVAAAAVGAALAGVAREAAPVPDAAAGQPAVR